MPAGAPPTMRALSSSQCAGLSWIQRRVMVVRSSLWETRRGLRGAATGRRVRDEVFGEEAERRQRWRGRHLDEAAVALAPSEGGDLLDLRRVVARFAGRDLLENGGDRRRLHAAGRALPALLGLEELGDLERTLDDARPLLE